MSSSGKPVVEGPDSKVVEVGGKGGGPPEVPVVEAGDMAVGGAVCVDCVEYRLLSWAC